VHSKYSTVVVVLFFRDGAKWWKRFRVLCACVGLYRCVVCLLVACYVVCCVWFALFGGEPLTAGGGGGVREEVVGAVVH
jgi:hypothetical protein